MAFFGLALTEEESDELLVKCDEIAGLLSLWHKQCTEVKLAVQDLSASAGLTPRPHYLSAKASKSDAAERQQASSAWPGGSASAQPSTPQRSHRELREVQAPSVFSFQHGAGEAGQETGSNSSEGSSAFDVDMDEEWTKRLHDLHQDLDVGGGEDEEEEEDKPAERSFALAFLGRRSPHILERIDEGSREDDNSASAPSSGASSSGSNDSSVERAWAEVPEAGYGGGASVCAEAAGGAGAPEEAGPSRPLGEGCSRRAARRRRGDEAGASRRREGRSKGYTPPGGGVSGVAASFRTRGPPGPKDDGPLSRLQEKLEMDTE